MTTPVPGIFGYWGKAAREGEPGPRKHLLVFHLLDVAAVGAVLLERHPTLLGRLAGMMGLHEEPARRWLLWLLAHHDMGKLAAAFQRLRPGLCPGEIPDRYRYTQRHDALGYLLWTKGLLFTDVFPEVEPYSPLEEALLSLLRTASGHHGKPPAEEDWSRNWFREEDLAAARRLSVELSGLFFGSELPPPLPVGDEEAFRDRVAVASWAVAGLAVLCDWIGSNRRWFPFHDTPLDLGDYWRNRALPQAGRAVAEAAVLPALPRPALGFAALFTGLARPTPLQRAADTIPLGDGPGLFLVEDLTGSGKTEAALTVAGRLLAAGKAEGLYVALPTTATADAMYGRVGRVYGRMFQPGGRPSLVLAHSRRDLSKELVQSVGGPEILPEATYGGYEPGGAAATCAEWLADNRKKALLAQVGVGTIDQALLAVLNVRHQSLRALGLAGKVLIVDEVHACDAYMNRLLERLLELHAAQGGSAILLSATLPLETRARLVRAFSRGAELTPPPSLPADYPQLLALSRDGVAAVAAQPPGWARRELAFRLIHDQEEAVEWLASRVEAGAAACWIRNTVRDAVEAFHLLAPRLGAGSLTLFHARFALGHRLDIERNVLARFGKDSGPGERRGRLVIATQVIEQSLDLDFDEMLSDLAPVDLLLQRAGRLRRHLRDAAGRRRKDPAATDGRGQPVLHVLSPDPLTEVSAEWIRAFLPGTAAVYSDHGELWRTARLLADHPTVRLPGDSRLLVEEVFGSGSSLVLPESLEHNAIESEGRRHADASQGRANAIDVGAGYGGGFGSWSDREDARTRLGDETVTLRLARWDGGALGPMCPDADPHTAWRLSEVSVRTSLVSTIVSTGDPELAEAIHRFESERGGHPNSALLVPMSPTGDGAWTASVTDGHGNERTAVYTPARGLEVK